MSTSTREMLAVRAVTVEVDDDSISVDLSDGRTIVVPLDWYPRLVHGSPEERRHWELIGRGHGIHWPDLDEDISVENLLMGQPSGESQRSFQRWLQTRGSVKQKSDKKTKKR